MSVLVKWIFKKIVTHAVLAIVTASLFAPMVLIISCFDLAVSVGGYYITSATIAARSILLCLAFIEFVIDIIVSGFFCWLSCYSQPYGVVRNGGYPNMQQPRGNIIQIPTNRVGPMYIQAGVGQPMMYQLPTIREQAPHPHSN